MGKQITSDVLRPLKDKIIVLPEEEVKEGAGGFIIPAESREKQTVGKVVAVGDGMPDDPMTVKVGDIVLFPRPAGS